MRIETVLASNLTTCRFLMEREVHAGPAVFFPDKASAAGSPLAEAVFAVPGVTALKIAPKALAVTRGDIEDWPRVTRAVAEAVERHARSGQPAVAPGAPTNIPSPEEFRRKVEELLDAQINPAVASHGGSISLVEVRGESVVLRMSGGCQGCASSTATLKQGVERTLRDAIPALDEILDETDHAAGANPYYQ